MLKQFKKYFLIISLSLFYLILLYGGLGVERETAELIGLIISVVLFFATWMYQRKLKFPRGFGIYAVLMVFLILNYFASLNPAKTLEYAFIYIAGGIYWLSFYNAPPKVKNNFYNVAISLGLFFGFLYFLNFFKNLPVKNSFSLFSTNVNLHNHLGDLWALILVIFISLQDKLSIKKSKAILLVSLFFVIASASRSAYLAIFAGVTFYYWKKRGFNNVKKIWLYIICGVFAGLFIFIGVQKSLLSSRLYYVVQSLKTVSLEPEGVGMGNFGLVTYEEMQVRGGDKAYFSEVTHNIVLEFIVGMGFWGIVFVIWLVDICSQFFDREFKSNLIYQSAFIAIFTNFMFDYTYLITTLAWLAFSLLGLAQQKNEKE